MALEREVKLSFPSASAARTDLLAAGAVLARARRLQDDSLYDTTDGLLRAKGSIIRVRTERWADGSITTTLTLKGPVQPGAMKIREEHETGIENAGALAQVFDVLGLRLSFRYQKYREELSAADLVIAIDETPVGIFVELEGSDTAIRSMTSSLGRTSDDFILDSYYRLFHNRREQFGLPGPHMVFGPT